MKRGEGSKGWLLAGAAWNVDGDRRQGRQDFCAEKWNEIELNFEVNSLYGIHRNTHLNHLNALINRKLVLILFYNYYVIKSGFIKPLNL